MNKTNIIKQLFQEIKQYSSLPFGYNIFKDSNITDEKINIYLVEFYKHFIPESFSEGDVDEIYINKEFKYGFKDQYKYIVNNVEFLTNIIYYKSEIILNQLDYDILNLLSTENNIDKLKELSSYLSKNINKYIFYMNFTDITGNVKQTNMMGLYAMEVLGGMVRACKQSQLKNNRYGNTCALYFNIDKTEGKRNKIYSKIIKNNWPQFDNFIIDSLSNELFDKIYCWK